MKEFNTEEYNKMCAEFIGAFKEANTYQLPKMMIFPPSKNSHLCRTAMVCCLDEMQFDKDWNWIMEVVEKIESLETETSSFEFHIHPKSVVIKVDRNYAFEPGDGGRTSEPLKFDSSMWIDEQTKKEAIIQAIWEFLNWYKENKL